MKVVRTQKEFTLENMPLEFIQRTVAIGCLNSMVLKYGEEIWGVEIAYKGKFQNGSSSVHPWSEEHAARGYVKAIDWVKFTPKNGFDSYAIVFPDLSILSGRFKESHNSVGGINAINWINLLLEFGFVEITE